jgi:hypothetical protein
MSGQVMGKVLDKNGVGFRSNCSFDSKTNADTDFDGNFNINANLAEKATMLGFEATTAEQL